MNNILTGGFLKGKKTYITSFVGLVSSVASYFTGAMALPELIQTVFPLLGMVFLRKGIEETENSNKKSNKKK